MVWLPCLALWIPSGPSRQQLQDALNTTGVWKVDNQLRFRYRAFPSDQQIDEMIRNVFYRDVELNPLDIHILVDDNHVILSGTVEKEGQKVRAENIVSQIEGVLTVENQVLVKVTSIPTSDEGILEAINDNLFWSPYIDSDSLTVTVTAGRAYVKGAVVNRFAARMAVQNAFDAGARTVRTRLALDDGSLFAEYFNERPSAETGLKGAFPSFAW